MREKETHPFDWAVENPPIGYWVSDQGTFEQVESEDYVFFPDGSGVKRHFSAFSGITIIKFLWKYLGIGELSFFWFFEDDELFQTDIEIDPNDPDPDDIVHPDNWDRNYYCASWKSTDISKSVPVLLECRRDKDGNVEEIFDGFMM